MAVLLVTYDLSESDKHPAYYPLRRHLLDDLHGVRVSESTYAVNLGPEPHADAEYFMSHIHAYLSAVHHCALTENDSLHAITLNRPWDSSEGKNAVNKSDAWLTANLGSKGRNQLGSGLLAYTEEMATKHGQI